MIKVMIVDDEEIIRNGIGKIIKWNELELILVSSQPNGKRALDSFFKLVPDIIITDIKMPEMDGITLIENILKNGYDTKFIVLTGFADINYAKKAMKHGVKEFILKPCDYNQLIEALVSTKNEIIKNNGEKNKYNIIKSTLYKVLPEAKEQILTNYILGSYCSIEDIEFLKNLLDFNGAKIRIAIITTNTDVSYIMKFALKGLAEDIFNKNGFFAKTTVANFVVIIISLVEEKELIQAFVKMREFYLKHFLASITVFVSDEGNFVDIPILYQRTIDNYKNNFGKTNENVIIDNYSENVSYNRIVLQIKEIVENNISNENLNLKWIAQNKIYMNEDYLSKLFIKNNGEKFSSYLTNYKIKKATEILLEDKTIKVTTLAKKLGYGDNIAYFCCLFKLKTGLTVSEYKNKI